jgi:hypothetical protein
MVMMLMRLNLCGLLDLFIFFRNYALNVLQSMFHLFQVETNATHHKVYMILRLEPASVVVDFQGMFVNSESMLFLSNQNHENKSKKMKDGNKSKIFIMITCPDLLKR